MEIRQFKVGEERQMVALFQKAVHSINSADYSERQLQAWVPDELDIEAACARIRRNKPFVVVSRGEILAYADLQPDGYIDQFFCHPDHLGKGIATQLFLHLKDVADVQGIENLHANVSITARPFFERMGFSVLEEQHVNVRGQVLTNYRMAAKFAKDGSVG